MKVLGIVGSCRKMGNTEIVVKEALFSAKEAGAEARLVRLTDFKIEPCKGCMTCVFKKRPCPVEDDAHRVYERMREFDAIVLAVPTYVLGPAGTIKMLLDRAMGYMYGYGRPFEGRPALSISVAGIRGWEPYALPLNALFLRTLGYTIVDQFMVYGQGPGEVLYDREGMDRVRASVSKMVQGYEEGKIEYQGPEDEKRCPYCHNRLFLFGEGGMVECPNCGIKGEIVAREDGYTIQWEPTPDRWVEEMVIKHFEEQVLPSGPRFMKRRQEIRELTRKYRE